MEESITDPSTTKDQEIATAHGLGYGHMGGQEV
jgi:hypothetical protein